MPNQVFSVIYDAAHEENRLRDKGYTQKRIGHLVGIQLSKKLIDLQLNDKVDTHLAFPPERADEAAQEPEMTEEQEIQIERLMNTTGISYDEALHRIAAR